MMKLLAKTFGTKNDREVNRLRKTVEKINNLETQIKALSDDQLTQKTAEFRERYSNGESLDSLLPEAFAVCREASVRTLGMRHYDVQLIGGMVLQSGRIAEMKTGEGKTLTATLAVYLNAIPRKGVHLITVNDYLASRDAEWMGKLYAFLGLTTGTIVHGMTDEQRQQAYASDVTYGTNNEFGFDYLRDNMKKDLKRLVQREPFFCIVDEVDSILIDEARTPLIISGPAETATELYVEVDRCINGLRKDSDYIIDEKSRVVTLTEDGIAKMEKRLRLDNLYDPANLAYLHHTQQALKSHVIFKKDVDYVVRDGKVVIVDENTGRLMPGRRYSEGLHGALEAKEGVNIENETQTLATITFQNYFRLYEKLSGMTGTADTEAVEFKKIYKLDVVVIPTNKPLARLDHDDIIYRSTKEKFNAIADDIADRQKRGQPILVGTVSVEKSELLSSLLKQRSIPHEILNAKNHSREAQIIEKAGHKGNVTISTNMAGRGTDIVLGEGVKEAGGLCVIGTERHESRRIDNQLRGRSGRQGDPGASRFFLALDDDLMRIFASDKLSSIMGHLGMKEGESIEHRMLSNAIEKAQKRVEEQHFSSRKHTLEYDDVMNQQRKVIYGLRKEILHGKAKVDFIANVIDDEAYELLKAHSPHENSEHAKWEFSTVEKEVKGHFNVDVPLKDHDAEDTTTDALAAFLTESIMKNYDEKRKLVGSELLSQYELHWYLETIDTCWKDHLHSMDHLSDSVRLRGYGQRNPLQEYKKEAYRMFEGLMGRIESETALALARAPVVQDAPIPSDDLDTDQMEMTHPEAEAGYQNAQEDENLVYHGSRSGHEKPTQETYRRDHKKVGRNDPCHCGSGQKYKKCHGRPGASL